MWRGDLDRGLSHHTGPTGGLTSSQPAAEVSAQQDVDKRVDAAGGVAEADRQVVAGVVGQSRPADGQVDQLQDVVGSDTH